MHRLPRPLKRYLYGGLWAILVNVNIVNSVDIINGVFYTLILWELLHNMTIMLHNLKKYQSA
jgi:hypothetical protein